MKKPILRGLVLVAAVLMPWLGIAQTAGNGVLDFTEAEKRQILSFGPWPVQAGSDPSNRVSGHREARELGELMFFDHRLSGNGQVSCSTCHLPERYWTDNLKRGVGQAQVDRNTPHLFNLSLNRWFSWDGAADSLWFQSIRPILDQRELAATPGHVATYIRKDRDMACRYEKAFGVKAVQRDDEALLVDVGKALAAFQEILSTGRTPFDEFRDALERGDMATASRYTLAAQRGLRIFIGKGACATCHVGPNFTNGEFHNVGVSHFISKDKVDGGRHTGIAALKSSKFNLLGPYNDDPQRTTATATKHVAPEQRNFGEFRVPSLRQSVHSSPYMHNGEFDTLRQVVDHYSNLDENRLHADGEKLLRPLRLTEAEKSDLVVFLETLTNHRVALWRGKEPHEWPPCN